jgi:hypothetical protein
MRRVLVIDMSPGCEERLSLEFQRWIWQYPPQRRPGILRKLGALAAHPEVARASIHSAAVMGDDVTVRELLATEPALAGATGGPRAWDPLTYLCFSRYLRLDRARSAAFARAARALLGAGASARDVLHPSGHADVDALVAAARVVQGESVP